MGSENWTHDNLAWMAGFYEGEGTVGYRSSDYNHPNGRRYTTGGLSLAIPQNELDVLTTFLQRAGVGKIEGPYYHKTGNQYWRYIAQGVYAYGLLIAMWPWLHSKRRREIAQAVDLWRAHSRYKIPADVVREIRTRVANGEMQKLVALDLGIDKRTISAIVTRRRYINC